VSFSFVEFEWYWHSVVVNIVVNRAHRIQYDQSSNRVRDVRIVEFGIDMRIVEIGSDMRIVEFGSDMPPFSGLMYGSVV